MGSNTKAVSNWRRRTKARLVEAHGGKCVDCGFDGPPFVFDFDHVDPKLKSFPISGGPSGRAATNSYESKLQESMKCDLVCANCHRMWTHRQRCSGCEYC